MSNSTPTKASKVNLKICYWSGVSKNRHITGHGEVSRKSKMTAPLSVKTGRWVFRDTFD